MTPDNIGAQPSILRRLAPIAVLAAITGLVFATGLHTYLSLKTIGLNYDALKAFVADNIILAVLAFAAAYVAVVALSLPGALIMTLTGGLLFGWQLGAATTVIAATIGATILFLVAKTSFGETLAAKAGPWLAKLRDGFQQDAFNYLLFLRLVPAFPFFIVNLAPALLGVPLKTFVGATLIGIMPGTIAFSVAGAGLGSVIESQNAVYQSCLATAPSNPDVACPYTIDTSALVTRELLAAFVLLGIVALIPIALKKMRGGNV